MMPMRAIMVGPLSSTARKQGFDRGLSLLEQLLGLGELLDVFGGVPQGNELTAFRRRNRFVKFARPISHDAAMTGQRRRRDDRTLCRASGVADLQRSRRRESR